MTSAEASGLGLEHKINSLDLAEQKLADVQAMRQKANEDFDRLEEYWKARIDRHRATIASAIGDSAVAPEYLTSNVAYPTSAESLELSTIPATLVNA